MNFFFLGTIYYIFGSLDGCELIFGSSRVHEFCPVMSVGKYKYFLPQKSDWTSLFQALGSWGRAKSLEQARLD